MPEVIEFVGLSVVLLCSGLKWEQPHRNPEIVTKTIGESLRLAHGESPLKMRTSEAFTVAASNHGPERVFPRASETSPKDCAERKQEYQPLLNSPSDLRLAFDHAGVGFSRRATQSSPRL